ncbi:MAG: ABC transporter permease [Desulfobacteraceae bacterium]|nr:MAG: ABC transporter permease [Desulfobacteraceae bacterium]
MITFPTGFRIAYSHVLFTFRRLMMVFILVVQPVFFVVLTWLIYRHSALPNLGGRMILSAGLTTLWSGIVFSSLSDMERERMMGTLEMVFASTRGLLGSMIPKVLGNLLLCTLPLVVIFIGITYILRFPVRVADPVNTVLSGAVLVLCLFSISLCLSCVFALSRQSRVLMNAFEFPIFTISGFVFPVVFLPAGLRFFSYLSPLTYPVQLLRSALLGPEGFFSWPILFWISLGILLLFFGLAVLAFHRLDKIVRLSGTLSLN